LSLRCSRPEPCEIPTLVTAGLPDRHEPADPFGARRTCLYLIRPDGYVGYREQPPDPDRFAAAVERVLRRVEQIANADLMA
jgi:hypothetical protein